MKFELERLVLSGPIYRLFLIALAILAISAFAGYLAYAVAASRFEGMPGAILIRIRPGGGKIVLNPPKEGRWSSAEGDEVVVLSSF